MEAVTPFTSTPSSQPAESPSEAGVAQLRSYAHARHSVARALRDTGQVLERRGSRSEEWTALQSRLAEDRFQLVVLGQFKRGKSSLINAIVGRELLPTAIIPLTSIITALSYGDVERVVVRRAGFVLPEEIPVVRLAEYVTERGNPHNEKGVVSAEIEVPATFLGRGVRFIDTPGVGSVHTHNSAAAYRFLPEVDAAIFVTSADSPLTDAELTFLDAVRQHVRRIFFVLNKADQLDDAELGEAIQFTADLIARRLGVDRVELYPLSARRALAAKAGGDSQLLDASGLPRLEAVLAEFLARDRGPVFLVAILDRALHAVERALLQAEMGQELRERPREELEAMAAAFEGHYEEIEAERRRLLAEASAALGGASRGILGPALATLAESAQRELTSMVPGEAARMEADRAAELVERLGQWLLEQLETWGARWLEQHAASLEQAVQQNLGAVAARLISLPDEVETAARAILGAGSQPPAPPPGITAAEPQADPRWQMAAFDLADREWKQRLVRGTELEWEPVLLPRRIARRVALKRVRQHIVPLVQRLCQVLDERCSRYIEANVRSLELSSASGLREAQQQIQSILHPTRPAGPSDSGKHDLEDARERLSRLRDSLLRSGTVVDGVESRQTTSADGIRARELPFKAARKATMASGKPGSMAANACALCGAIGDAVFDFLCGWQYRLATDSSAQQAFRAAGGFCPMHTWMLERVSSPHGLSSGLPPLLEENARQLSALSGLPPAAAAERIAQLRASESVCFACEVARKAEQVAVEELVAALGSGTAMGAFRGTCLGHLEVLLGGGGDAIAQDLLAAEARRFREVAEAMDGYALKVDAHRRGLLTAAEERAYRDAIVLLAGEHDAGAARR